MALIVDLWAEGGFVAQCDCVDALGCALEDAVRVSLRDVVE